MTDKNLRKEEKSPAIQLKGMKMGGHGERFKPVAKPKRMRQTLVALWRYLERERLALSLMILLALMQVVLTMLAPYFIGSWVDSLSAHLTLGTRVNNSILGVILVSYVGSAVSGWLLSYTMAGSTQRIVQRVRSDLFLKVSNQPLAYFDQESHGDTMSCMTNDVELMSSAFSDTLVQLISGFVSLSIAFVMMAQFSVWLTAVTLLSLPLIYGLTRLITIRTRPLYKSQQETTGMMSGLLEETLEGLDIVQAFQQEDRMRASFEELNVSLYQTGRQAQIWTGLLMPMMNVINNLSYALIGLIGGVMVFNHLMTLGALTSFINYSRFFVRPVNEIASMYNTFMASLAGAERVLELLERPEEQMNTEGMIYRKNQKGDVRFEGVLFHYQSDAPVLKHLSLHIEPGKKIALVGPTGAGKTTIAMLLARFYKPTSGCITLDGHPLEAYEAGSLSAAFGIVLQDPYLFEDTILNNVRYGRLEATDDEVIAVCKNAHAHSFIQKFPLGYLQPLTMGGDNLSSGEKQLLSIARAMLANPSILILDEATSSVDTETEKEVQKALLRLMQNRTSLIIAHRLSTIKDADRIVYIQGGTITEQGRHRELMALKGDYYNQLMHQYAGEDE